MADQQKMSLFNHYFPRWHLYCPAMAKPRPSSDFIDKLRQQLDRCWGNECDIDPLILRERALRRQGRWLQARCIEQELQPIVWFECDQSASA